MAIKVRNVVDGDRARCLELLDQLAQFSGGEIQAGAAAVFDALLDESRGKIIVAEEDGIVLGMASVSYNQAMRYGGEYCQLEELIVDPKARGKNLGGLLVQATIDDAKARGCPECGLYLVESTEQNQPFYEKYGFVKVGSEMRQALDGARNP
jgi:GNAT superfamily N-acetyltransferase